MKFLTKSPKKPRPTSVNWYDIKEALVTDRVRVINATSGHDCWDAADVMQVLFELGVITSDNKKVP